MTTQNSTTSDFPKTTMLKVSKYNGTIHEVVEQTKNFITKNNCFYLDIDITGLNLIDATKLCILCSTFHYAKYCGLQIAGAKIKWIVKDEIVKNQIEMLKLDNIEIEVKKQKHNYVDYGQKFCRTLSLCR